MARKRPRIYPRKLANGEIRYDVSLDFTDAATGRRTQRMKTFRTEREARTALAEHEARRGHGGVQVRVGVTLAECTERWLAAHGASLRPGTLRTYQLCIAHHIVPYLGSVPTAKISMNRLEEHYAALRGQGVQPGMLRNVHHRLRQILGWGALHGFDVDASALQTRSPRYEPREITCWTDQQMAQFLAVADDSRYGPIWRVAMLTGLRRGELMALRWSDIDSNDCTIRVARTRGWVNKRMVEGPTKNGTTRSVSVPPSLVAVLREHHTQQLARRLAASMPWVEAELVFTTGHGTTIDPRCLARDLNALVARAGLAPIRIHDLRHTHASYLLRHGKSVAEVAKRLGHKNQAQTLRTYSHCIPDEHKATALLLEQMFG